MNRKDWEDREKQWRAFARWEESAPEAWPECDLAALLTWYDSAWQLAKRFVPGWADNSIDMEKIERIARIRAALSVLERQQ